jgi:hypothetical protein
VPFKRARLIVIRREHGSRQGATGTPPFKIGHIESWVNLAVSRKWRATLADVVDEC